MTQPEVEEEERWIIEWPDGTVYSTHTGKRDAEDTLRDLGATLSSYMVPAAYRPAIKRRKRTVTKSAWQEIPSE